MVYVLKRIDKRWRRGRQLTGPVMPAFAPRYVAFTSKNECQNYFCYILSLISKTDKLNSHGKSRARRLARLLRPASHMRNADSLADTATASGD